MDAREAYIRLNLMDGVGPVGVRTLADALGGPGALFTCSPADLEQVPGARRPTVQKILSQRESDTIEQELEAAEAVGARVLTPVDEEYPEMLRTLHDPPMALYVQGAFASQDGQAVGIVGTRSPSQYGRQTAHDLAARLSRAGVTVVSGLARGIDTAVHEGALDGQGRTIAFIGSGLNVLYPKDNEALAERIGNTGAIVSEFAMNRKPDRTTFAIRNRLIAGLSRGVVVVEAGVASGAMITANAAGEQGRTVFAVPGRVDNPRTRGPHDLLRNGACLVESVDDILEELALGHATPLAEQTELLPALDLSEDEQTLMAQLADDEQSVDSLIRQTGLAPARVNALLVGLEMKRAVRMLPGRRVARR